MITVSLGCTDDPGADAKRWIQMSGDLVIEIQSMLIFRKVPRTLQSLIAQRENVTLGFWLSAGT
jgi:hypothetical protein